MGTFISRMTADEPEPGSTKKVSDRALWSNPIEFILSLAGYAVGLTNLLRFPYVCMKNGGGAFLIPYFICVLLCAIPVMFLEMVMGQYGRTSCISCWERFSPICKGVGYGTAVLSAIGTMCYQSYYAWMIFYMYKCFSWDLPWSSCNQTWNTPACVSTLLTSSSNSSGYETGWNLTSDVATNLTSKPTSAAEEFFHNEVLDISPGINELGGLKPHLVVCHVIGWLIIYLCIIKGVKSVGKVIYVTATAPYVFIIAFIVRAALLPGSLDGILYFITPNFERLGEPQIWLQAFIQVFFSLGLAWGGIITMASYNKFHHPLHREAIAVPIISSCTSLMCGFLVFSVAGFLAQKTGTTVAEAINSGPGLAFVTYPETATHLPGAPIWAFLFFFMLIMTGIDSQFVTLETCISAVNDEFRVKPRYQPIIVTVVVLVSTVASLPFMTGAGMYIFQVYDWYFALVVFVFAVIEMLAMVWIYGHRRLFNDVETMIGRRPFEYVLTGLWGVAIPILLIISLVWSVIKMMPPTYGDYVYPSWVPPVGMCIPVLYGLPIPIVAIYRICASQGFTLKEKLTLTVFGDPVVPAEAEMNNEAERFI